MISGEDLGATIARELERAQEWDVNEWEPARIAGLEYYNGVRPGAPSDGDLSAAVSSDVADMVEAVLAQMQPAFTGAPPVEFQPEGEEDESDAARETFVVHRILSRNGQDFIAVSAGLRDAMLARCAVMKVWTEEREDEEILPFDNVPVDKLGVILSVPGGRLEDRELVVPVEELEREERDGQEVYPEVKVRVTRVERALKLECVAPENFRLWANWRRPTLAGCPFQAERRRFIRGELASLGIGEEMAQAIPRAMGEDDATALERQADTQGTVTIDPELEEVELWDVHIAVDWDGNGRPSLKRCWYADTKLAGEPGKRSGIASELEECEFTPYAAGQIILQSHRFLGLSLADRIGPTQTAKTEVLRQWLDNLAYMNNGRLVVVQGGADPMAVEKNNKPGGVIPSLVPNGVSAIIGPDAGPSALAAMNYLDKARSEAGGASLDMQTAGSQVKGETWRGIERQYGAKELMAGLMLRTFAETALREVYLLAHRNLRRYPPGVIEEKISGEWIKVDPSQWRARALADVQVGVAGTQMQERAQALRETIAMQMQALQAGQGGELTDIPNMHNAILGLERAKGLENPERYWIDPRSQGAVKAGQAKRAKAQADLMQQAGFIERIAALQAALGAWEKRLDASVKYFSKVVDAEIETMKVLGQSTAQLEALQTQGLLAAAGAVPRESPAEQVAREMGGAGKGGNGAAQVQ